MAHPRRPLPEQLAGPDSRWANVDGSRVHYEDYGIGDTVFLLLHGFGASTFSWREVVGPLSEAGRVIAFDRPGFGLSERPMPGDWLGETPYSDTAYVNLTVGLLDVLGVERAVLVGHSAGGAVATLMALTHPERVAGLVLVAPALGGGRHGLPGWLRGLGATPQLRRIGPRLVRRMTGRLEDLLEMAWHDASRITPEVWAGYRRPLEALDWDRALWEIILAPRAAGLDARLPELAGLPVLYITGEDDRIVPAESTTRLAGMTPGAGVLVVPECGHLPQEECAAEFARAVLAFLVRVGEESP